MSMARAPTMYASSSTGIHHSVRTSVPRGALSRVTVPRVLASLRVTRATGARIATRHARVQTVILRLGRVSAARMHGEPFAMNRALQTAQLGAIPPLAPATPAGASADSTVRRCVWIGAQQAALSPAIHRRGCAQRAMPVSGEMTVTARARDVNGVTRTQAPAPAHRSINGAPHATRTATRTVPTAAMRLRERVMTTPAALRTTAPHSV